MPTSAEVRAQLTGPGGMFEVVTEDVLGRPSEVYASRMPSLRSVAEVGLHARRRPDRSSSTATAPTASATFVQTANGVAHALRDRFGLGQGRPGRRAVAEQPGVVPHLLGHGVSRARSSSGLNGWWTTDEIEYGLQDSGAKVLVADQKRFERIAGSLDQAPDLEHVFLDRLLPRRRRPGRRPAAPRASTSSPARPPPTSSSEEIDEDDPAVIFYTSGTTGRPKGAISTHRSMIANLQNTMYGAVAGAMGGGRRAPRRAAAARTSPCSPRRCSTCRAATRPSWSGSSPASSWSCPRAGSPRRRHSS